MGCDSYARTKSEQKTKHQKLPNLEGILQLLFGNFKVEHQLYEAKNDNNPRSEHNDAKPVSGLSIYAKGREYRLTEG